ncbi:dapper homolog 3-like isoform X1 [Polypterus senegalus]|uniref:dapper homolog 3-like isoform X1 n=1 Tax=Polypterus senegalus TaxID=55291 RepID=UPI0019657F27|nr:dapper homolog 3-like isoform X1 [Polypterus senegalus]
MLRAFSFPIGVERSRNKERLEASLAGLCELEFLKQRQEFLVLSALGIHHDSENGAEGDPRRKQLGPASRSQDDLTLRRQLNSLKSTPWGLMSSLEQQVGELRVDADPPFPDPPSELADSRPSSAGFYELSEGPSPVGLSDSVFGEFFPSYSRIGSLTEARINYANERPKSVGDLFLVDQECLDMLSEGNTHSSVPRSFSAPYNSSPEGNPESGGGEPYIWEDQYPYQSSIQEPHSFQDQSCLDSTEMATPEDIQQAHRVESYILGLIQRRGMPHRPTKPRTSLNSDPNKGLARQNSLCRRPVESTEGRYPMIGNSTPSSSFEGKPRPLWACRSFDQSYGRSQGSGNLSDSYPRLPLSPEEALNILYARPPKTTRPASLEYQESVCIGSNLGPSMTDSVSSDPDCPEDLLSTFQHYVPYEERQEYRRVRSPPLEEHMVNAQYIPAQQPCQAQQTSRSSGHTHGHHLRHTNKSASFAGKCRGEPPQSPERYPFHHQQSSRGKTGSKKCRFTDEGGSKSSSKKSGKKACRSQSENSLLGQRVILERKYNTVEREELSGFGRGSQQRPKRQNSGGGGAGSGYRRWRSTLEISQDESEPLIAEPPRRVRKPRYTFLPPPPPPMRSTFQGYSEPQAEFGEPLSPPRAPVCLPEDELSGYGQPCAGDSESSLSEADTPGSSSVSSDSDESGGLVWPQQLPPQLAGPPSSSSSPSSSSTAQPKVFVKIKASHALKKKILRFRTGSLKVMTTV